ncbi:hypothetical protein I316_04586 [Kwoniella heveanensis BCC8398]|uniref:Uncharacterized protein n=1 Tax=Kwoniella heveanensis BCC8398 TaxID=1296120 RepID=A0A1B9GS31_9TREE|nr:hypothetical protein I316_04586 [Kwoniella heveanensis BCC8398]
MRHSSLRAHPYHAPTSQAYGYVEPEECLTSMSSSLYISSSLIPISPPAPHRKAPKPPNYSPRRDRPRHIHMREPASCGLFTVAEDEEDETMDEYESDVSLSVGTFSLMYDLPSAVPSSEIFPSPTSTPSPETRSYRLDKRRSADVPRDVDEEMEEVEALNRLSWSSRDSSSTATITEGETDSECRGLTTPKMENDDPFGWQTIPLSDDVEASAEAEIQAADSTIGGHFFTPLSFSKQPTLAESIRTSRRPPPLTLTTRFLTPISTPTLSSANPFSAVSNASTAESDSILTPRTATTPNTASLLPALPIVSSCEWSSRTRGFSEAASPTTPTTRYSSGSVKRGHARSGSGSGSGSGARSRSSSSVKQRRKSPEDPVDLAMALEELLSSCGERVVLSSSESEISGPASVTGSECESSSEDDFEARALRFPLPPSRYPTSPLNIAPRTPTPAKAR